MAGRPRYTKEDRRRCEGILKEGATWRERPLPLLLTSVGRLFLGTPYEADTLEQGKEERLVANLRGFDCVTFVETVLALAIMIGRGEYAFPVYLSRLEHIRYRRGRCQGFVSRLHYFTDWLHANSRKGMLRDMTAELGGLPYNKSLCSISANREKFPALADKGQLRRLRIIEGICSRRRLHFLPREAVGSIEGRLAEGDIIAVTTEAPGIDVLHVGLAACCGDRIHLLHASSAAGRVLLSEPLVDYLARKKERTGIIVARPRQEAISAGRRKGGAGR